MATFCNKANAKSPKVTVRKNVQYETCEIAHMILENPTKRKRHKRKSGVIPATFSRPLLINLTNTEKKLNENHLRDLINSYARLFCAYF